MNGSFTLGQVAAIADDHGDDRRTVGRAQETGVCGKLLRRRRHEVSIELQDFASAIAREEDHSAEHGVDGLQLILEGRHDAEISAAAAQGPEQVRVFIGAGADEFAVGGHDLEGSNVVDGEAVLSDQPAGAAAERQARDPSVRNDTGWRRQAVNVSFLVEISKLCAALHVSDLVLRVDVDAAHKGQIDDHSVVAESPAADIVSPAPHGDKKVVLPGEVDGIDDVPGAQTADDTPGS